MGQREAFQQYVMDRMQNHKNYNRYQELCNPSSPKNKEDDELLLVIDCVLKGLDALDGELSDITRELTERQTAMEIRKIQNMLDNQNWAK